MKNLFFLLSLVLLIGSCGEDQAAIDEQLILDYISDNNLSADRTPEGVYYIIDEPGGDLKPSINSNVTVDYKGYFFDDVVFDENDDISFPLWGVIEGWQIGIPLFGKEGSGTLIVPSHLAYGEDGTFGIPGNSVLVFDIRLIDFQ